MVLTRLTSILIVPLVALSAPLPPPLAHAVTTPRPAHTARSAARTTPPRPRTARPAREPHRVPPLIVATSITRVAAATTIARPAPRPQPRPRPHHTPTSTFISAPHTHAGLVAWSRTLPWPWPGIIRCESIRDDSWPESSDSPARGVFQFLRSSWRMVGGTGDPAAASWREQYRRAKDLARRFGLRSWDCARILGYA